MEYYINLRSREEPSGPVVGVLAAGLHVQVVQTPVLQLLAEILHKYTNTQMHKYTNTQIHNNVQPCMHLDTDAGGQVELVGPVQAQDGIKVARGPAQLHLASCLLRTYPVPEYGRV